MHLAYMSRIAFMEHLKRADHLVSTWKFSVNCVER